MLLTEHHIAQKTYYGLAFDYDPQLIQRAKGLGGKWNRQLRLWLFPCQSQMKSKLISEFALQEEETRNNTALKQVPSEYMDYLERRRYSANTIKTYTSLFSQFVNHFPEVEVKNLNDSHVAQFQTYLVKEKQISTSSQNQYINSIKLYFEKVLGRDKGFYPIDRPIKEFKLPKVLTVREIASILNAATNLKHKAMLLMVYGAGLRAGEVIQLKIADIDGEQMRVFVRGGKGKKDRVTILSQKALEVLREYFRKYRPSIYLFEGQTGGAYSTSSLRRVFAQALIQAGIQKKVTLHSLRHSFATHMLETGVDIRYIQVLLGHSSSRTTEIYTHITHKGWERIKSPLDYLEINL